jgi:poly(A) polymerase
MNGLSNIDPRKLASDIEHLTVTCKTISTLMEIAQQQGYDLYLVGGFLRDVLLGRPCKDVDFVSSKASELAKLVAKQTGRKPALIDKKFGTVRFMPSVHSELTEPPFVVDLSSLRGPTIFDDLYQRDFTINSLALDISTWWTAREIRLLDPFGGIADLEGGRLRGSSQRSLSDDPLRILRAYRLALDYGLKMDAQTREGILQGSHRLHRVSVERIRDEMMLILSATHSVSTLRMLAQDGILRLLLPECVDVPTVQEMNSRHLHVWQHRFEALEALECFLTDIRKLFADHAGEASAILTQKLAGERTREISLKLVVLLHDIGDSRPRSLGENGTIHLPNHHVAGPQLVASLCTRLRLSNKETNFISQLVRHHTSSMQLFQLTRMPTSALCRFFGLGPELFWPLLLLFASDYTASQGPSAAGGGLQPLRQQIGRWLNFYYEHLKPRELEPPLVSGHDLIKCFHLSPGPLIGRLLKALSDLQWEGRISTRQEAIDYAARLLKEI